MTNFLKFANAAEYFFTLAEQSFGRDIEVKNIIWVKAQPKCDFTRLPLIEGAIEGLFSQFYTGKTGKIQVVFNQDNGSYTTYRVLIQVESGYFLASMRLEGEKVAIMDIEESTNPRTFVRYSYKQGKWHLNSYSDQY